MVNYATTTLNRQGALVNNDVTYNVNVTVVNNELTRLNCGISKKVLKQYPNGNGGYIENQEDIYIGSITLEHGRRVIEVVQEEDVIPHLIKFQEILDEIIGKEPETSK